MARSRDYKMAIYPTIGYVFVMFILILFTGYKNTMDLTGKEQFTTPIGPSINDLVPYKYTIGC